MDNQKFIPERKQNRRRSDRDVAEFIANADIGLQWVGPDGIILWSNPYGMELLGYKPEEFIGHHISEFFADPQTAHSILEQLQQFQSVDNKEIVLIGRNNIERYVILSANVFRDGDHFIHARFFVRDVTDIKKVEEALRRKEEELRLITDTVPSLLSFIDKSYRYRFNNNAYYKWFGITPSQAYGKQVSDIVGSSAFEPVRPYMERALAGQQTAFETEITLKTGKKAVVSGTYTPRFNSRGEVEGIVGMVSDVTARKEAQQKLLEMERRFHTMADTAPVLIWTSNTDKQSDYFNKPWLEFTGRGLEEELGERWKESIHPDDALRVTEAHNAAFDARRPFQVEYRLKRADGQYRWLLEHGVPRFTDDGRFIGYIGSCIDITDRKQYERRTTFLGEVSTILSSSLDYETTFQNLAKLMVPNFADWCAIDIIQEGYVKRVALIHRDPNKFEAAEKMRQYPIHPQSSGLAKVITSGISLIYPEVTETVLQDLAENTEHLELLRQLGTRSRIVVPLKIGGKILGALSLVSGDSGHQYTGSDLQFAEEVARRAATAIDNAQLYQKMRESDNAKTQFLGMLAHELRNPMAPILSTMQLLEHQIDPESEVRESINVIERQVKHMSRLLDDLLDVSRIIHGKIHLSKKEVDLNTVITYAIETTRPFKEEFQHTLSVSLPSRPIQINADPVRLEQIIVNLLNNAYKYTEPRGTVWLTVTQQHNEAVIRVKDTGIGIAPGMLPKVFDLFTQADHTLSRSRGGMGIGLTLVKSLVEMHNGAISVQSAGIGKGTEFIVRLPITPSVPQPQSSFGFNGTPTHHLTPKTLHRILIVDDNKDAAHALGKLLEHLGHEVKIAYDGSSAIQTARSYQPGVILLDIGLPEMSGYEVAQQLRKDGSLKDTLLVAISGYGQEEDKLRSQEAGFDYHFTKPIGIEVLTQILT